MLSVGSRQDAEDVLQDVFVRAYGALRNDNREMNVRAWLYRVAHNRCIDHLRRPVPPAAEIFEVSRKPLHDPVEEAQRRDDLRQLVADVGNLPEQQRSALLMREIDGMTYADLAVALDVTVPAVKSLLVRARVGLVEAAEARDADCTEIHADLLRAYDRGVKASGRARKHMRSCDGCTRVPHRAARHAALVRGAGAGRLRPAGVRRQGARLLGGGGAAAGGAAAGGGGAAVAGGGLAAGTACKVAAVVCTAAIATGGAVEVSAPGLQRPTRRPRPTKTAAKKRTAVAAKDAPPVVVEAGGRPQVADAAAARAHPRRRPGQARAQGQDGRRRQAARGQAGRRPSPVSRPRRLRRTAAPGRDARPAARDRRRPRPGRPARGDAGPDPAARGDRADSRAAAPRHRPAPTPAVIAETPGRRSRSAARSRHAVGRRGPPLGCARHPTTPNHSHTRRCSSAAAAARACSRWSPSTRRRAAPRSAAAGCGPTTTPAPRCATSCGCRAR